MRGGGIRSVFVCLPQTTHPNILQAAKTDVTVTPLYQRSHRVSDFTIERSIMSLAGTKAKAAGWVIALQSGTRVFWDTEGWLDMGSVSQLSAP